MPVKTYSDSLINLSDSLSHFLSAFQSGPSRKDSRMQSGMSVILIFEQENDPKLGKSNPLNVVVVGRRCYARRPFKANLVVVVIKW